MFIVIGFVEAESRPQGHGVPELWQCFYNCNVWYSFWIQSHRQMAVSAGVQASQRFSQPQHGNLSESQCSSDHFGVCNDLAHYCSAPLGKVSNALQSRWGSDAIWFIISRLSETRLSETWRHLEHVRRGPHFCSILQFYCALQCLKHALSITKRLSMALKAGVLELVKFLRRIGDLREIVQKWRDGSRSGCFEAMPSNRHPQSRFRWFATWVLLLALPKTSGICGWKLQNCCFSLKDICSVA